MNDRPPAVLVDEESKASNPGELQVSLLRWLQHYPIWPLIYAIGLVGSIFLTFYVFIGFAVLVFLFVWLNKVYWGRVKAHFYYGCALPATIVSVNPLRAAVATDLTRSSEHFGSHPAIKIIDVPLTLIEGMPPKVGQKLACVALYVPPENERSPHWDDFDPRPIECVTSDLKAIDRIMASFDQSDWNDLEDWLSQVRRKRELGLHLIR